MAASGVLSPHNVSSANHPSMTPTPQTFAQEVERFFWRWTPQVLFACCVGYWSVGIAYELGIMASLDKVAIYFLKQHVGTIGVGALMPQFQWYSAWAVRTVAAAGAMIFYNLSERALGYLYHGIQNRFFGSPTPPSSPTPNHWVQG